MIKRKVKKKSTFKKTSFRKKKGGISKGYITYMLIGLALFAFLMASGFINTVNPPPNGTKYIIVTPTPYGGYNSLELHTLNYITVKPTQPTSPTGSTFCKS